MGFEVVQRLEFPPGENTANGPEASGGVCSAVPTDPDEVLGKFIGTDGFLDFPHDLVFHLPPLAILNPGVLDDTHLLCLLVHYLEHPCPPATWCVGADVIEQVHNFVSRLLDVEPEVDIVNSDSLDVGVETEVGCGGGGEDGEEFDDRFRVLGDVRQETQTDDITLTSNQSKQANTKGAARHNSQMQNLVPHIVTPKEKTRHGSLRMMWWRFHNTLVSFFKR